MLFKFGILEAQRRFGHFLLAGLRDQLSMHGGVRVDEESAPTQRSDGAATTFCDERTRLELDPSCVVQIKQTGWMS